MNLADLKRGIEQATKEADSDNKTIGKPHSTLIYGESKSGKTQLAATLANLDYFEQVIFLAPEQGVSDVLLAMNNEGRLSDEALEKITIIDIVDTRQNPNGFETVIKFMSAPNVVHKICEEHGVINCGACIKERAPVMELSYAKLTKRTLLVLDSLSQLGESAMNTIIKKQDVTYKPLLDDYGGQGKMIRDLLSLVQAHEYCHIIAITHVDMFEDEAGKKRYYPLCGSSKMSPNIAKYFGTVIVTRIDSIKKKHTAASSSTYSALYQTGTRTSVSLENAPEADLKYIYSGRIIPGEKYDLGESTKEKKSVTSNSTATQTKESSSGTSVQEKLAAMRANK